MSIFQQACLCENENRSFALIHIIESRGSTPRHSASMLVTETGETIGTIGGGMMERLVLDRTRQALADECSCVFQGRMARQGEHAVGSDCGGAMTVHIAVYPRRPSLILVGGGHVNRAIAQAAVPLNFDVHVLDTWQESLDHPDMPATCHRIYGNSFTTLISDLPLDDKSLVIIATNHQDKESLDALLPRPARFLGLLASSRKVHHFKQQLQQEGVAQEQIARLRSPVGLDIGAETPQEIAISVLAELLLDIKGAKKVASGKPEAIHADELKMATRVAM
ncbi:XdhC family protein [Buttiauxella selenatireducens]|uniref:XdhC family protein n=1 Tax=Buttiauxella selenatireducens TaxID=3073902 RepID=A0ABY9SHE1_9ENTR|nr:XdhC family protein [Buttiauxella sp. R73]WMY76586.1 XdhC family protein [Buttiauxella sp. R73]